MKSIRHELARFTGAIAVSFALVAFGCGDDDSSTEASVKTPTPSAAAGSAAPGTNDTVAGCVDTCTKDASTCRAGCNADTCSAGCQSTFDSCAKACDFK
ncbi:MAG TPA: hypothetical protein VFG30_31225 [Polyangiales bacterium]|nr:hypothetical protein [Polyangiales bacterium]